MGKKKKIIIGVVTVLLILSIGTGAVIKHFFFSMSSLPQGEFITESKSPTGKYTIKTYLCNGGATVDYAVRGELLEGDSKKPVNIFWQYKVNSVDIKWIDEDTVEMNGHSLDLPKDRYDWRTDKALSN